MKVRTKMVFWAALAAVALATTAGLAWACTQSPVISIRPGTGPAGADIVVTGANFQPGLVEIHWNSATGPLATTTDNFSSALSSPADMAAIRSGGAVIKAPDFGPGAYYLIAVQRDAAGAITAKSAGSFQVTSALASAAGASASTSSADLWSGLTSHSGSEISQISAPAGSSPAALRLGLPLAAVGTLGFAGALTAGLVKGRRSRAKRSN